MEPSEIQKRLFQLPEPVQEYVFGEQSGELNRMVIDRNGIKQESFPALFDLVNEAVISEIKPQNLIGELQKRLSLDPEKAKKVAMDIAGFRLLPLDRIIGDISGYVADLGGDPASYPGTRIKIEERTVDEASEEIVQSVGANSFEHRMRERLKDITDSFLKGVRTEAQVLQVLKKAAKTGGMEFDEHQANRVLEGMKQELKAVTLVEKKEEPLPVPGQPLPLPAKKTDDFSTITPETEKEIADIKAGSLGSKIAPESAETAKKIADSIEELYAKSGLAPQDEDLQKRLKTIIGNRLRDVRDSLETLETLVQPKELGGMSLSTDDARRLLGLIETKLREVHAAHAEDVVAKKTEWVKGEEQKKTEKEAVGQAKEAKEIEDLFRNVVAKSPKAAVKAASMPPAAMPAAPAAAAPVPVPVPSPIKPAAPALVMSPVPVAGMAPTNLPFVEPPKPVAPLPPPPAAIQPPRPTAIRPAAPPPPPITIVRPAIQVPTAKPRMEDIRSASPRLTGPVEELRATTLVDFRRLSKDPKEACMKIKDKVDLLADQSYDKRTDGIKAWGESEVSRTYVDQMREALDGKPMPSVIADRQVAKQPYLSSEEMAAVAEINRQLRY